MWFNAENPNIVTFSGDNNGYRGNGTILPKTTNFSTDKSLFEISFEGQTINLNGTSQSYEIKEGQTISVADEFSISSSNTLTIKGTLKF